MTTPRSRPPGLLATAALAASCCGCYALSRDGQPATPQRPTLSSDTSTTAVGTVELEAGGIWVDNGSSSVPINIKYGASENTEVFVGWLPFLLLDQPGSNPSGVGDLTLGFRQRFLDEGEHNPSLAVQSFLKFPTADESDDLGSGEVDMALAGIASKSFERWSLTGFAQLDAFDDPASGTQIGQSYALSAGCPLGGRFSAFGELAGVFVPDADSQRVFTTVGFTYAPRSFLIFDVAVVAGLSDDADDYGISIGFTQNFGRLWGRDRSGG